MRIGLAGAMAIGAALATVVLVYAAFIGHPLFVPLLAVIAGGLGALGLAIWSGATRWLLLLLPIFVVPAVLIVILFNCAKCIA